MPAEDTVLIAVHPGIARLLTRNVTLDGVFTCAAIGLVCKKVVVKAVRVTKGALGLITLVVGGVAARVTVRV